MIGNPCYKFIEHTSFAALNYQSFFVCVFNFVIDKMKWMCKTKDRHKLT